MRDRPLLAYHVVAVRASPVGDSVLTKPHTVTRDGKNEVVITTEVELQCQGLLILTTDLGPLTTQPFRAAFAFLVELVSFTAVALVLLRRSEFEEMPVQQVVHRVLALFASAIVLFALYFGAHQTVVGSYSRNDATVRTFAPIPTSSWATPELHRKYTCRAYDFDCSPKVLDSVRTADQVAEVQMKYGDASVQIPRGLPWWG